MASRKPKATETVNPNDERLKLIDALKFAAIAAPSGDETVYTAISNGYVSQANETFTIAAPTTITLETCPQGEKFLAALANCKDQFQVTQLTMSSIAIKSDKFSAIIPAISQDMLTPMIPDANIAPVTDLLKDAFRACCPVLSKKDDRVMLISVLMQTGSCVATNGAMAIEIWHGCNLPTLLIPKKTAETIAKITKPLIGFGLSDTTATFWFDDGSWLKTRLVQGKYPNVERLYGFISGNYDTIWPDLLSGLDAISKFVEDDTFYIHSGFVGSHNSLSVGASFSVANCSGNFAFSVSYFRHIIKYCDTICISKNSSQPFAFKGPNSRALLMGKTW